MVKEKQNQRKKGFTLVELLVAIVILGIITAMAYPLIRKISTEQENKKYVTYHDSINSSAKLYADAYSVDLFGYQKSGCAYVTYEDLKQKKLFKDIQIPNMSCQTDETYVKIVKVNEKYSYSTYIGCGNNEGEHITVQKKYPQERPTKDDGCGPGKSTMKIEGEPDSSLSNDKKIRSVKVMIKSSTGIAQEPIISAGWSSTESENGVTEWSQLKINRPTEKEQNDIIFKQNKIVEVSDNLSTKEGLTGDYYLILKVDRLYDLAMQSYSGEQYVYLGPYRLDNEAPDLKDSTIISSQSGYNDLKPKLKFGATDNYTPEKDLRMCISYERDSCGKTLSAIKAYKKYDKNAVLDKVSTKYDGLHHNIYVTIADKAGNYTTKKFDYRVSKRFTIKFDSNGGEKCSPESRQFTENTKLGPLCVTNRLGYIFKEWNTAKNGNATVITKDSIATRNMTVYAQWELMSYKITYNLAGGEDSGNPLSYTVNTNTFTLKNPTKKGYTFTGWIGTGVSSKSKTVTIKKGSVGNRTYTANWSTTTYKLTYNSNGGTTCNPQTVTKKYNTTWGNLCKPTRTGYTFGGWYSKKDGTGVGLTSSTVATKDVTVYAKWTAKKYSLTYNSDGGTTCNPSSITKNYNNAWGTLCTPTKTGYTFGGWYTSKNGAGNKVTSTSKAAKNLTVYAKWTISSYKLTYDSVGGSTCNPSSITKNYNNAWGTLCIPSKTGHKFGGWYTSKNGGGSQITNTSKATANVTAYAKWIANTYTITYNGNGHTGGTTAATTCEHGKSCTLRSNGFSKTGYTFAGWYTKASGGTKLGTTATITSNTTVYAHWTQSKPTCTISLSGTAGDNGWYKSQVTVTLVINGTATNYGLDTNANSTNKKKSVTAKSEGTTVYNGYVANAAGSSTCSTTVKIDTTKPKCTNSGDSKEWTKNNRTISWGCSDATSKCNSSHSGGSKKFDVTKKTAKIAAYTIKDNAGNSKSCPERTADVYVDKDPPVATTSGDSTFLRKEVLPYGLTIQAKDVGSGLKSTWYAYSYTKDAGGNLVCNSGWKKAGDSLCTQDQNNRAVKYWRAYFFVDNAGHKSNIVCSYTEHNTLKKTQVGTKEKCKVKSYTFKEKK